MATRGMALDHRLIESNGIRLPCVVQGTTAHWSSCFTDSLSAGTHSVIRSQRWHPLRVLAPDLRGYHESQERRVRVACASTVICRKQTGKRERGET